MKRIDKRTVELTRAENLAADEWDDLLDVGQGILDATQILRGRHPRLDPKFFDYLEGR